MKAIAINGGPRKKWNTSILLNRALEGAAAGGAETETVHLYDLNFKGCVSCFACKTRGGTSYGRCGYRDGLSPVLEKIAAADILLIGSPIYFGTVTGELRSFLERLLFPYGTYTEPPRSLFPGTLRSGLIYTMNVSEEQAGNLGYFTHLANNERVLQQRFGSAESLYSFDTLQFEDYAVVEADRFDPVHKAKCRQEIFPVDVQKAFELGKRLATDVE
ncbi:MAG: flavodoxin family protein [Desulfuromonadaceae bacterium]